MTTAELIVKFRQYIDEPDQTFVSDSDVSTYLADGYREFRNMVCDINPMIYNATQNITLSNAISHDLANVDPKLLGANSIANPGRMVRLNTIVKRRGSDGRIMERLEAVSNEQALDVVPCSYYLANTILRFSTRLTGTYEVNYVPESIVDWADGNPNFVDNLTSFHDLIALLAYRQYAIVDGAESEPILRQAAARMAQFKEYLQARAYDGYDYIQTVPWYS